MKTSHDDLPADDHLRAALRHAPDADLSAPAHLSAQIIAAGHRAAAEATPAANRRPRFWQTPWALGGSSAFATLVLAGFMGLLWRGETPGPAREEAPLAAAPAPSPAAAVVAQAPAEKPAAMTSSATPATPRGRAADVRRETNPPPPPARVTEADAMVQPQISPFPSTAAPAPEPTPAPAPSLVPPPPPAAAPMAAAAPAAGATPAPSAAPAVADADAARATQQIQRRAFLAERAAPGAIRVSPLPEAPWMAALAEGLAVQWRLDGVPQRHSPSSWLYALGAQAQGRWVPSTQMPGADERSVLWQRGDVVLGRLWLNDERVLACDAQARCQEAVLAPDIARELLKSMPR